MRSEVLEGLKQLLPLVPAIVGIDMQLSLSSRTQVLGVWQAKSFYLPGAESGVELSTDNPAQRNLIEVMNNGKATISILPKELLGETIKGILTPVFENGEVVGVISCAISLKKNEMIQESTKELFLNLTQTQTNVEEIAKGSIGLAEKIDNMRQATEEVKIEIESAVSCVTSIRSNASRSNMLALNGSIEAVRAGEGGKGFGIIAQEMRKFAQVNNDSAKRIIDSLQGVSDSIRIITDEVGKINSVASEQVAATQDITATLQTITDQASELREFNLK